MLLRLRKLLHLRKKLLRHQKKAAPKKAAPKKAAPKKVATPPKAIPGLRRADSYVDKRGRLEPASEVREVKKPRFQRRDTQGFVSAVKDMVELESSSDEFEPEEVKKTTPTKKRAAPTKATKKAPPTKRTRVK